ncbi:MAG: hypothetical protein H6845_02685 [Alphaproteobacteria bacterium]|nr:MAG: hypothetical protein H6845_02685 [Alphaproteobacteria bacterium]
MKMLGMVLCCFALQCIKSEPDQVHKFFAQRVTDAFSCFVNKRIGVAGRDVGAVCLKANCLKDGAYEYDFNQDKVAYIISKVLVGNSELIVEARPDLGSFDLIRLTLARRFADVFVWKNFLGKDANEKIAGDQDGFYSAFKLIVRVEQKKFRFGELARELENNLRVGMDDGSICKSFELMRSVEKLFYRDLDGLELLRNLLDSARDESVDHTMLAVLAELFKNKVFMEKLVEWRIVVNRWLPDEKSILESQSRHVYGNKDRLHTFIEECLEKRRQKARDDLEVAKNEFEEAMKVLDEVSSSSSE